MLEEEHRHTLKHAVITFIAALLGGFLAFYVVMDITLAKMFDPMRGVRRAEKMIQKQAREMQRLDNDIFMPASIPLHHSLINMVKENNAYKFIIDLNQLNNNDKNVEVTVNGDTINIKGVVDKTKGHKDMVIEFSQTFALGAPIIKDKVTKEEKGDKYIITVPIETEGED